MASADENAGRATSAPSTETLGQMTPEAIYAALTTGAMVGQARDLTDDQKRIIAEFFGGRPLGNADAGDAKNMTDHCDANPSMGRSLGPARLERLGQRPLKYALSVGGCRPALRRIKCLR